MYRRLAFARRHNSGLFLCVIILVHAPTPQTALYSLRFWLRELRAAILKATSDVVLPIDANARLGGIIAPAAGGMHAETEDAVGSHFPGFLFTIDLSVPKHFLGGRPTGHMVGPRWPTTSFGLCLHPFDI